MKNVLIWLLPLYLPAQNQKPLFTAELALWKNNKPAAVSITFDDADYTEFEYAFPLLEKYGFKATFGIVGEWTQDNASFSAEPGYFNIKKMGWKQLKTLSQNGHELAAHGYHHRKFPPVTQPEILLEETAKVKKLIETRTGKTVYTYHYPYSFVHEPLKKAVRRAGFRFGRAGEKSWKYNNPKTFDPYEIVSVAILNDTTPSAGQLKKLLENQQGRWLVLMYHRLFPRGSKEMKIMQYHKVFNTYSLYPETFEKHMQILKQSHYWIAPVIEVGSYALERRHARLKWKKHCGRYVLKLFIDDPHYDFGIPLTVILKTSAKSLIIKQNKHTHTMATQAGTVLLKMYPNEKISLKIVE